MLSREHENAMWRRAKSLGLPSELVVPAIQDFLKWASASGEEFAISRFKAMKVNIYRRLAGQEPTWAPGQYPSRGIPWYKGLVTLASRDRATLSKVLSLLNCYTAVFLVKVSKAQWAKFAEGLKASPEYTGSKKFEGRLRTTAAGLPRPPALQQARWIMDYPWSGGRNTPSVSVEKGKVGLFTTKPELGGVYDSILLLLTANRGSDLLDLFDSYPNTVAKTLGQLDYWTNESLVGNLKGAMRGRNKLPLMGGTISFIQEAGGKLRSVANPYRWWQTALDSLASSLFSYLKTLPWDCTHDQVKGIPFIQQWLKEGKRWYSVDLSSATDHFPLALQVDVLRQLYQGDPLAVEYISLFEEVSRMPWWYRDENGAIQTVKWEKGQPLGLRPSFASFALTHGLVLLTLLGKPWSGEFWVLGDDVVIGDPELYVKYRNFLRRYELPVSEAKTLEGNAAEFASLLILPDAVVPVHKWRGATPDNFVDLARLWGPSSLATFRKEEVEVLSRLKAVPPEYGGLGWGDPSTWDFTVPKWMENETGLAYEMSNLRHYMHQVYTSSSVASQGLIPKVQTDNIRLRDNALSLMVQSHLGLKVNDPTILRSMISNLDKITPVMLPVPDWDGNEITALMQWKKRLGLDDESRSRARTPKSRRGSNKAYASRHGN